MDFHVFLRNTQAMKKEVEVEERDHEHDIRHAKETKGNENESKGVQFTAAEIPLKK